jgi:hypothetical protein
MRSRNPPMPSINSVKSSAVFSNRCSKFVDSSRRGVCFRYPNPCRSFLPTRWSRLPRCESATMPGFPFMVPVRCSGSRERSFRDRTWP